MVTEGDHNVVELLEAVAVEVPERAALISGADNSQQLTWAQLSERSRRLAAVLAQAGVGLRADPGAVEPWESPHHHVALYLYNGPEYMEGMLGSWMARAASININYRYVASELAYVLADSAARAIIIDSHFAAPLAEVLDDLPELKLILQVGESEAELLPGAVRYEDALRQATPAPPSNLSPDDHYVLYTGGTTGKPKGVLWHQGDFLATCLGISAAQQELVNAARSSKRGRLRTLLTAPLMHGAAQWNALSALIAGGSVVFPSDPTRLDPADILQTCERAEVTSLQIVGDAFARPLLDEIRHRRYDLAKLGFLLSGGAILSATMKAAWCEAVPGLRIVDVLGSSETGRQAVGEAEAPAFKPGPDAAVLSHDKTRHLRPGEPEAGWLAQRGRVPLGYLGDPTKTEATFPVIDGVRYAVAGDRVRLAADGQIELLGREAAVINTGGEKVFAEEVEQALTSHPAVADALVVGRSHPRWGQEVVAVVQQQPDSHGSAPSSQPDDNELRDHCRLQLAGYKLPKAVIWVEQVKRSPSGKPDYAWARGLTGTVAAEDPTSVR